MSQQSVKCARTACPATRYIVCRHTQTDRLYCPACARAINEHNPGLVEIPHVENRGQLAKLLQPGTDQRRPATAEEAKGDEYEDQ